MIFNILANNKHGNILCNKYIHFHYNKYRDNIIENNIYIDSTEYSVLTGRCSVFTKLITDIRA